MTRYEWFSAAWHVGAGLLLAAMLVELVRIRKGVGVWTPAERSY